MGNTCYLNRIWIDEKIILAATEAGLTNDTFQGRSWIDENTCGSSKAHPNNKIRYLF